VKVTSALICDDIRREITGKDILIGVYAGDIIVPQVPFSIPLTLWFELSPEKTGPHKVSVRLSYAGEEVFKLEAGIDVQSVGPAALPLPSFQLASDKLGELVVEFSADEKTWAEVKRKKIIQGAVVSLTPPPTKSG
jgi:hypothetical protein